MITRQPFRRFLPFVLLLAPVLLAAEDRIEFDNSSDTLLLKLDFKGGGAASRAAFESVRAGESYERPPAMRIFGDGRIVIHQNVAEEYRQLVLPREELRQILQELLTAGIHELDARQLQSGRSEGDQEHYRNTGRIRLNADLPTCQLDLEIDGYAPEGEEIKPVDIHVSWQSLLGWPEGRLPETEIVQRFIGVEQLLTDLHKRVRTTGALIRGEE